MSRKKGKFSSRWASQTRLGRAYGLSGVEVGKILIGTGLKDPATGQPTGQALAEGWATATPLRDGRPHFMWSGQKVRPLLRSFHPEISQAQRHANDVLKTYRAAERQAAAGEHKLGILMADCAYDDVPEAMHDEVRQLVERALARGD